VNDPPPLYAVPNVHGPAGPCPPPDDEDDDDEVDDDEVDDDENRGDELVDPPDGWVLLPMPVLPVPMPSLVL
jgi:hypothetical protein